jgi:cytoskeletal protein CcmA (bactofilin family)
MFGGKKKDYRARDKARSGNSTKSPVPGGVNTIDEHTTITGDLEAGGDIRIDGKLVGGLTCGAKVIIGVSGSVEGNIVCEQATIEGTYTGELLVRDLLTLKETATVSGTILAKQLSVGAGCKMQGSCTVTVNHDPKTEAAPMAIGPATTLSKSEDKTIEGATAAA